jgi:hypothetical protein
VRCTAGGTVNGMNWTVGNSTCGEMRGNALGILNVSNWTVRNST